MFHENSGLVKVWVSQIKNPNTKWTREDVPSLQNLREAVHAVLDKED